MMTLNATISSIAISLLVPFKTNHKNQLGFAIVDENYDKTPPAEKDVFWDGAVLPMYAEASVRRPVHALVGSAAATLYVLHSKMTIVSE